MTIVLDNGKFGGMEAPSALRAWRKSRNLTLRSAGDELGCDPSYVGYLERGGRVPPLELALRIEEKTGIPARAWLAEKTGDGDNGNGAAPAAGAR